MVTLDRLIEVNVNRTMTRHTPAAAETTSAGARETPTSRAVLMIMWVEDSSGKVTTI